MAIVEEIQLQDGSVYELPSGGGTYTLSISGNTITLTGSGGDTSSVSVPDDDTTYSFAISGHTLTITPSSGSAQTLTLPDEDTTYTINISGNVITLTDSDGNTQSVTIPVTGKNIWYGTCSANSTTIPLVVTTTSGDFVLATGNMVRVKFTSFTSITLQKLNVDSTGAVNIVPVDGITFSNNYWIGGEVVDFVYDGTNFVMVDGGRASTTRYGITMLSSSVSSTAQAEAATPYAVKKAYDLADSKQDALVSGTNIKTINGNSILGSGDLVIPDDDTTYTISISGNVLTLTGSDGSTSSVTLAQSSNVFYAHYGVTTFTAITNALIAGDVVVCVYNDHYISNFETDLLTFHAFTIVDDHNDRITVEVDAQDNWTVSTDILQEQLVSGTNIKTINNISLLGSGNMTLSAEDEIFFCEYGTTTYADIADAYADGKTLICVRTGVVVDNVDHNYYFELYDVEDDNGDYTFNFRTSDLKTTTVYSIDSVNGWSISSESATATPTANRDALFDSDAKMNSTDMTASQVDDFVDSLNFAGTAGADYVVEQGTSGNWIYRKWNSGLYECFANTSESWAMTNRLGSSADYYGIKSYDLTALAFTSITSIQVTGNCQAYYFATKVETYSTTSLQLTAISAGSRTDTIRHFINIIGKWK